MWGEGLYNFFSKWSEGEASKAEMHVAEWNADDGDVEDNTKKYVGEDDDDTT